MTPDSPAAQAFLSGLQIRIHEAALADGETGALKQLYGLVMREADVLTLNTLFHTLALVFLSALLLMPWVRKVSTASLLSKPLPNVTMFSCPSAEI